MSPLFQGVQWIAPTDLGISQLYLNKSKLEAIEKWFNSLSKEDKEAFLNEDWSELRD